ncbi:MAG: ATP-grasp domain-containing protein [Chloroflexota bacterium]
MLLMKSSTYRAGDFMDAAGQLDIEVIRIVDTPEALAHTAPDLLAIPFADGEAAVRTILEFTEDRPVDAILSVDDSGALLAARASQALSLAHNDPQAAQAARDKYRMRTLMAQRGVPVPGFRQFTTADDPQEVAQQVSYPCVVKPLRLSGSRGVIRADDAAQLVQALQRLAKILQESEAGNGPKSFLVEDYLPGDEVALEGLLDDGELHVLALFDKPDPLEGPFFEETIYVTPSRLPQSVQEEIAEHTAHAARALGLQRGPVHAELRINERGPWLLEIAGRSIGGLCSRVLRFGVDTSLESLILRQAVGMSVEDAHREATPRGVMMIPIPQGGLLRGYDGVEEARAVAGVTGVEITAPLNHTLNPLPEGDSYLGFIFARGETPAAVEAALREAHAKLRFRIDPVIPLHVGGSPG